MSAVRQCTISFIVLTVLLCFTGCYPVYKTLQAQTDFIIVEENQKPVEDAEVILISSSYPYGSERFRVNKFTNGLGKVRFNSMREFRIESLMMHGKEEFFWNWCVYKDGYETVQSRNTSNSGFLFENTVVLKKGNSQRCKSHLS